ncbi:hypothetical protein LSH36_397g01010, partial [Paralvinella palmiformis]
MNGHDGRTDSSSPIRINNIAEIVASTGETINISDSNEGVILQKDDRDGFRTHSILCKPIRNAHFETIGVAQLMNKIDDKTFDEYDEQLFEVLSYHASVQSDEMIKFKNKSFSDPSTWKLNELQAFNDYSLDSDQMLIAALRIFIDTGLLKTFEIEYDVSSPEFKMSSSPLCQLYGTQATLEHHHFNHAVMILNSDGHNIFANLSSERYSLVMNLLKEAILATD